MKLKYDFVINEVAGQIVAVSVGNSKGSFNGYINLNKTGAFIFEQLKNDTTREEIIKKLSTEYPDASQNDVAESVDEIIDNLSKAELLV